MHMLAVAPYLESGLKFQFLLGCISVEVRIIFLLLSLPSFTLSYSDENSKIVPQKDNKYLWGKHPYSVLYQTLNQCFLKCGLQSVNLFQNPFGGSCLALVLVKLYKKKISECLRGNRVKYFSVKFLFQYVYVCL